MARSLKGVKCLLLDADETIFQYEKSSEQSLEIIFDRYGFSYDRSVYLRFVTLNNHYWKEYERGKLDKNVILTERFSRLFSELGLSVDAGEINALYRKILPEQEVLFAGAYELLEFLHERYTLVLVTNGGKNSQERRIERAGIGHFFKGVFISDLMGCRKPQKEFFDIVFQALPDVKRAETAIIGDSLGSDMRGGRNAGITTVWYNPSRLPNEENVRIDYEVRSYEEIKRLLQ